MIERYQEVESSIMVKNAELMRTTQLTASLEQEIRCAKRRFPQTQQDSQEVQYTQTHFAETIQSTQDLHYFQGDYAEFNLNSYKGPTHNSSSWTNVFQRQC